ncbi:hypothetical protein [Raoultella ornithinolytica]|uniref:hypothetical protein n=1 Tax=Raoultella ornithinolytica TaxID=54291 RepID=UPI0036D4E859
MMKNKNITLTAFLLMMLPLMKPLHAEPRLVVMDAFIVDKHIVLSNLSVTWATIDSSAGYPTSLHPYDDGYRYYGPAIQGREYSDAQETSYRNYWDTLYGGGRTMIRIKPEDTWVTLAEEYGKTVGANGTGIWAHFTPAFIYALVKSCTVVSRVSIQATYIETDVMPDPLSCSNIPQIPEPAKCDLDIIGSNIIDHGTLQDTEVNGHRKTANITIRCTKPAAVEFRLLNQPVELGNGITSTVTIEGSATPVIDVSDFKNVTIASMLSASNPTAGPFSGNVIVIANVQ